MKTSFLGSELGQAVLLILPKSHSWGGGGGQKRKQSKVESRIAALD